MRIASFFVAVVASIGTVSATTTSAPKFLNPTGPGSCVSHYTFCGCEKVAEVGNGQCVYQPGQTLISVCDETATLDHLRQTCREQFVNPISDNTCPSLPSLGVLFPLSAQYTFCGCPSGSNGNGKCVYQAGPTKQSVCNDQTTKDQLSQVCTYSYPPYADANCDANGQNCCPAVANAGYQYTYCGCPTSTIGNGKCVYSPIETLVNVCTQSDVINEITHDGACTCPTVCTKACVQGSSCQADSNGCVACRPNPTTYTPITTRRATTHAKATTHAATTKHATTTFSSSCPKTCNQACVQGLSCKADSHGCFACRPPTTPAPVNGLCPTNYSPCACANDLNHGWCNHGLDAKATCLAQQQQICPSN